MIKAEFDMPKLIGSLKKASKAFGDTNKTAIARWGAQTCRELAVSTQVYGKGGKPRKKQVNAIEKGVNGVIASVSDKQFRSLLSGKSKKAKIRNRWVEVTQERLIPDEGKAMEWIESHRDENGRTPRLDQFSIGIAPMAVVRKVVRMRSVRAGIAKGAWIGAGVEIAKKQKGANKINIGKNFLGYAQKHSARGDAKATANPFNPIAFLRNKSAHSGKDYVLSQKEKDNAVGFGLRKTINWYRMAAKKALDQ